MNNHTVKILSIATMAVIAALFIGYFFGAYGAVVAFGCPLLSFIAKDFTCQLLGIEPEYIEN